MISFFKSIFKSENDIEGNAPTLMTVTLNPLKEFSDMSNLSSTSVVGALNLVGMDTQNNVDNMQKCIKKGFHEMNQSVGTDI